MSDTPRSDIELATMLLNDLRKWGRSESVYKFNVVGRGSSSGSLESNLRINLSEEERSTLDWIWERFRQNRYLSTSHGDGWARLSDWGYAATESDLHHLIHPQEVSIQKLDGLTGLPGKDDFKARLRMLAAESDASRPLSLIFFDLDHFKKLNDTLGHDAGDKILAFTAAAVRFVLAGFGEAFRWGGDEFAVLLPNHNLDKAASVAEKIRKEVGHLCLDGKSAGITTSVGVSAMPETTSDIEELEKQADKSMYASKKGGRNRVTCFSSSLT